MPSVDPHHPFLGRDGELRQLVAALEDVRAGKGRAFALIGEPGIGKTRLCDELVRIAEASGVFVAWGRSWEAGGAPPYWPWTQIVRALAAEPRFARAFEDPRVREVARIVPELANTDASISDALEARFRLFEAMSALLASVSKIAPLVLVLDDVHVADDPSLRLLHFVARGLRHIPALVVVTQRDVAARPSASTTALLHDVGRECERLQLRRLTLAEVEQWIAISDPTRAAVLGKEVFTATEGNPLFVDEVLRVTRAGRTSARLPDEVRSAIGAHLALLDDEARTTLEIASVIGREVDADAVAELGAMPRAQVERAFDGASRCGVLFPIERRGSGARFAFSHALLRDELHASLEPSRRAALHRTRGTLLKNKGDSSVLSLAAFHLLEGADAGADVELVIAVARSAAQHAFSHVAYEEAALLFDRAATLLPPNDPRAIDLALDGARARIFSGEGEGGRRAAAAAAERARANGDRARFTEAALVYGTELIGGRVDPLMVTLLEEALAMLPSGDDAVRARLLARLASAVVPGTPAVHIRARDMGNEAIAIAQRLGDDNILCAVLPWAIAALGFTMTQSDREPLVRRMVEVSVWAGDTIGELRARQMHVLQSVEHGDVVGPLAAFERCADKLQHPNYAWRRNVVLGVVAISRGELDEADRQAHTLVGIADHAGPTWNGQIGTLLFASVLHARGATGDLPHLERFAMIMNNTPFFPYFKAWIATLAGQFEEARASIAVAPPLDLALPVVVTAGETAAKLGDRTLAARAYELMQDQISSNPFIWGPSGAMCIGPLAATLGRVAFVLERFDESVAAFEEALARCDVAGFPTHRAQIEHDLARALRACGRESDRARADQLDAKALASGESFGMTEFVERVRADARSRGAPSPTRPSSVVPPAAIAISIDREGDVWRLSIGTEVVRLKDGKGVRYLERLVREPGRDIHVFDLVGLDDEAAATVSGDAGPSLDPKAKAQLRERVEDLRETIEEARRFGDRARAEKAEAELETIAEHLAAGVGLGGRDRKAASNAERARINVQRRLKDVVERITEHAPTAGRWLEASLKTGTYCAFSPV